MSFLHDWLRSIDNNYRRSTAAEQAIIDGQDDLEFEVWQLRQELSLLREELARAREQAAYRDDDWFS